MAARRGTGTMLPVTVPTPEQIAEMSAVAFKVYTNRLRRFAIRHGHSLHRLRGDSGFWTLISPHGDVVATGHISTIHEYLLGI